MGCEECDKAHEDKDRGYYFRIGKGIILVYACEKHVKMLQDKIRGE